MSAVPTVRSYNSIPAWLEDLRQALKAQPTGWAAWSNDEEKLTGFVCGNVVFAHSVKAFRKHYRPYVEEAVSVARAYQRDLERVFATVKPN